MPVSRTAPKARPGIFHVVQRGENLFRIGQAYDVPYHELAAVNGIRDPARIYVGQKIFVPGATRQLPVAIITPGDGAPASDGERRDDRAPRRELVWPVRGVTVSGYGARNGGFHDGIDISAPEGTPIRAVLDGDVIYSDELRGYGKLIIIRHDDGLVSVYSHNRRNRVREGQRVAQGDIIAEVGTTGRVSGPHLHFEIRQNNKSRDPLDYLPRSESDGCLRC
ncbi:MAG TPA: LysM peptidoglycan-binding domain-containing M23 family metallopeptidase [Candidatus Acidoferrales bacterium]|nr:LysM peptidoglycan-binding domain-containing M23 family metallopeptidase [Candidatus Acidoferrales bacterium]